MIYLTGAFRRAQIPQLASLGVGAMLQPGSYAPEVAEQFPCWAADNGCFAQGAAFSLDRFYRWLDRVPQTRCLFAVAPDVYGDAAATLVRSTPILGHLRNRGFKTAYVLQDGAQDIGVPWEAADALFVGATDQWKLGAHARDLVAEARQRGKWVHMGRVNSEARFRYSAMIGCHSSDGTFLKFRNRVGDGSADLSRWFRQGMLPFAKGVSP